MNQISTMMRSRFIKTIQYLLICEILCSSGFGGVTAKAQQHEGDAQSGTGLVTVVLVKPLLTPARILVDGRWVAFRNGMKLSPGSYKVTFFPVCKITSGTAIANWGLGPLITLNVQDYFTAGPGDTVTYTLTDANHLYQVKSGICFSESYSHTVTDASGRLVPLSVSHEPDDCSVGNQLGFLIVAESQGNMEKVKNILKEKPDLVFCKYDVGGTPLQVAARLGKTEMAEFLLANKADVNAKDDTGATPLYLAVEYGSMNMAELLLANKADVNTKNNDGWTPLHVAARLGRTEMAKLLLASKADVNAKDDTGGTPLHLAAKYDSRDVAELLLANGADVDSKNIKGWTPLHVAAHHKEVAELLRQHGGHQ